MTGHRQERRGHEDDEQDAGAGQVAGDRVDHGRDEDQQAQLDRVVEPVEGDEPGQPAQPRQPRARAGAVVASSSAALGQPGAARDTWTMSLSDLFRMITTASRAPSVVQP